MSHVPIIRTALVVLGLSLASGPDAGAQPAGGAAAPLYRIELIVFANHDFDRNEELFELLAEPQRVAPQLPGMRERPVWDDSRLESLLPDDPSAAGLSSAPDADIAGTAPAAPPQRTQAERDAEAVQRFGFRVLRPDELELGNVFGTLNRLQAYTPLLHGGWVQEARPERTARSFDLAYLGRLNPRGTVQLYMSRFPNLRFDLSYQPDTRPNVSIGSGLGEISVGPRYRLTEDRRIPRNGELHYIDHPAFGIIVVVRPQPQEQPREAPAGPAA